MDWSTFESYCALTNLELVVLNIFGKVHVSVFEGHKIIWCGEYRDHDSDVPVLALLAFKESIGD